MSLSPEQVYCDLVAELQYTCPDAPSQIIERALIDAMRKIGKETCVLQTALYPVLQDHVPDYDLGSLIPDSYEISKIMCVELCGCCIKPIPKCTPCPYGYEMRGPDCIVLHPTPCGNRQDDLLVQVALVPCHDMAEVPEDLIRHDRLIHTMALRQMLGTPKQDYTDIRMALSMDRMISGMMVDVACEVVADYTSEPTRVGEAII